MVLSRLSNRYPDSNLSRLLTEDDSFNLLVAEWVEGLAGITALQIDHGLREDMKRSNSFPPVLPEFIRMCKGSAAPYHQIYKGLPAPKSKPDPEFAKQAIANMRKMIGGSND